MGINIYVGNLSSDSNENELKKLFEAYGSVDQTAVVSSKFRGRPRGFGIVRMRNRPDGIRAIQGLNSKGVLGQSLKVMEVVPKTKKTTFHVIPRPTGWAVKREGATWALRVFPEIEKARKFATELMKNLTDAELVIHEKDGSVGGRISAPPRKPPLRSRS